MKNECNIATRFSFLIFQPFNVFSGFPKGLLKISEEQEKIWAEIVPKDSTLNFTKRFCVLTKRTVLKRKRFWKNINRILLFLETENRLINI